MVSLQDFHLRTKLTLLSVATSAVALMCVVIAFFVQDYRLVKRVKSEQVDAQMTWLAYNLLEEVGEDHWSAIPAVLQQAATEHGVVAARWLPVGRAAIPAGFDEQTVRERHAGWLLPVSRHSRLVTRDGKALAELVVYVSHTDVEARILYLLGYSAMAFALAIFIAFLVAHKVQKWVSRPLLELYELSQQVVSSGNYQLRSQLVSRDEVGRLARAFNQMLAHIENRDTMLEKQVSQRTRELRKLAEDFRYRALHDTLTGLPNRALLLEEFNRAVAHANRVGKHFSLLLLDLDNFKNINDTYGHEAGDELLKQVAKIVRGTLRGEDIVCRLGGDEFVLLLEDVESDKNLHFVGKTLLAALNREVWVGKRQIALGVSIGASVYPQHGITLEELKHNADIALYRAKEQGRNQLVVFDTELAQRTQHKTLVQSALKTAARREELELHFQPQVDTRLKIVVGCEVFLRWHHQGLGFMQPADFIADAEEIGIIAQIDYFVLREACRICSDWRRVHDVHLPVSVNVSSIHFRSDRLVEVIGQLLREHDLPANFITLELRDDVLLHASEGASEVIAALRALGIQFALGDFGLGYFSLEHWRTAQIDTAHLHRNVVKNLNTLPETRTFVGAVKQFADALGITLVAQGVEDQTQVKWLESLGCHVMQGFVFTQPLRPLQFLDWLNNLSDLHLPQCATQQQRQ